MGTVRYLLDENVDPLFRKALLRHEPEMVVWKIGDPDAPPKGTLDPEILVWCQKNGFILVTNNRKSMPVHLQAHLAAEQHVPGIFVFTPNATINEIIEELCLIWEASDIEEYFDLLHYIPFK